MSEPGTFDDARSLLGAYALNAVDADERAAVDALVATDPAAARELASLLAVAATLGDAIAADPPPALRAAVLAEIATTRQVGPRHAAPGSDESTTPVAPATHPPAQAATEVSVAATESPTSQPSAAPTGEPPAVVETDTETETRSPTGEAPTPIATPGPDATVTDVALRRRPTSRWFALAAAVVIGAAIPTALAVQQAQRAHHAEQQQQALADLLTDPSAVVVHGTVTGGGAATAVLTDSQAAISASDLSDPGAGHVYQLWVIDDGLAASAGILADSGGSANASTDHFAPGASLAITVEPEGGSTQPTTDPVVILTAS